MFSIKSKKRQEEKQQPAAQAQQPIAQQPTNQPQFPEDQPIEDGLSLSDVLETLRQIHEGACVVSLLVVENKIVVQSSQKIAIQEQK